MIGHCFFHEVDEEVPDVDVYRVCFECGHIWTRETLEQEWLVQMNDAIGAVTPIPAEGIGWCQACIHDW